MTKENNGVMTTYIYDDNDRLLTEGGYSYAYDNNGNMLSKAGNSEQMNLTYNALNQLVQAEMTTMTSSTTVDYAYNHDGIRVGKTINGTDVITYIVDKNRPYAQVLEEQRTQSALSAVTNYVYGDDLLSQTTDGVTHYYQYDVLGSTRSLSDASGTLIDTYSYDAYGMLLNSTGTMINPYLYRGEQYDADLRAYYLRARYYQPGIGRFLTTDPMEAIDTEPLSLHRYVYGNDNPLRYLDPSGKRNLPEMMAIGAVISAI
ncbi:MAG: RHS repeat-associated core domain-containing protein, partial [Gammaproteobacteria bacterium]|nr:RHS repeat-associated core domain-containing protein [Gammaproteobacteria bacterium]